MKRRSEVSLFEMLREPRHKERDSGASGVEGIRLDRGSTAKETSKPKEKPSKERPAKEAGKAPRRWFGRRFDAESADDSAPRSVPIAISEELVVPTAAEAPEPTRPAAREPEVRKPIAVVDAPEVDAPDVEADAEPREAPPRRESLPTFEPARAERAELSPRWVQWLNTGERLRRATLIVLGVGWLATLYVAYAAGTGNPSDESNLSEVVTLQDADWLPTDQIPVFKKPKYREVIPSGPTVKTGDASSTQSTPGAAETRFADGEGWMVQCLTGRYVNDYSYLADLEKQGRRLEADLPGLSTQIVRLDERSALLVVGFFDSEAEADAACVRIQQHYKGATSYPGNLLQKAFSRKYKKDQN